MRRSRRLAIVLSFLLALSVGGIANGANYTEGGGGATEYMWLNWNTVSASSCSGHTGYKVWGYGFRFQRARTTISVRAAGQGGQEGVRCDNSKVFSARVGPASLFTVAWGRGDSTSIYWTPQYSYSLNPPYVWKDSRFVIGGWWRAIASEGGSTTWDNCFVREVVNDQMNCSPA